MAHGSSKSSIGSAPITHAARKTDLSLRYNSFSSHYQGNRHWQSATIISQHESENVNCTSKLQEEKFAKYFNCNVHVPGSKTVRMPSSEHIITGNIDEDILVIFDDCK